ncbi:hypothetical protein JX265_005386 [Neoarthrinium moseri]|uniref:Protein kinase domain-containing protein n=1 Tax=Neoarthrinium moseri TaxID=1658444 RepID=A0A9Q0AMQ7_9PEZI|nr:hypothetical protein JX265_005386 [Neoarthrinium moseri]
MQTHNLTWCSTIAVAQAAVFTCVDKEIIVLKRFERDRITKVKIPLYGGSQKMVCKVATSEDTAHAILREIQCLQIIAAADLKTPLTRIPKLLRIVRSSDHGVGVIGLVETYVPHTGTLSDIDLEKVHLSQRTGLIRQIKESITELHRIGITWTDIKADNIRVNITTNEAWLIYFGGGGTDKWADMKKLGTVQGDLAIMRKLEDYLNLGEQYHITKRSTI